MKILTNTLCQHSFCNLFKTGSIGSNYIISFKSIFLGSIYHAVTDIYHNSLKFFVYLFKTPA
ncbi:hypothetical protein EVA_08801 [gut metagenome]|uniref:Uncharacterized protein n=1 Tax=gut metagenome TaxID=749906 RepID=J9G8C8_9ZZZZ